MSENNPNSTGIQTEEPTSDINETTDEPDRTREEKHLKEVEWISSFVVKCLILMDFLQSDLKYHFLRPMVNAF